MGREGRPRKVLEAMHGGDRAALSAMGKKGAEGRERKRTEAEERLRWRNEAILERDSESNVAVNDEGDVVPPDDLLQ